MKKILLGILIASSFAMSGDLAKCSHAINMADKYYDKLLALEYQNTEKIEFRKNKSEFYYELLRLWREEAGKECEGILDGKDYIYASTGDFKWKGIE